MDTSVANKKTSLTVETPSGATGNFDFDSWAKEVRQKMLEALDRRGVRER